MAGIVLNSALTGFVIIPENDKANTNIIKISDIGLFNLTI
jgi:hypothetical protein